MPTDPFHTRLLAMVNRLPGAYEDRPWGSVHCKVQGKIFVGWGRHDDGVMGIGFKTDKTLQAMLVASDPRFSIAAYVGKHGWVDMKLGAKPNWDEVETFIVESYRMIAPKKLVKELDARGGGPEKAADRASKRPAARPKKAAATAAKRSRRPSSARA